MSSAVPLPARHSFESAPLPGKPQIALTIAGFDPSSGAGITADLQVFAAHGLFGTSCITALTVQSTQGVAAVESVDRLIAPALQHLQADLPPAGIKLGMLGTAAAVLAVAGFLRGLRECGSKIPVVLDPVLRSSSGASLLSDDAMDLLDRKLLPLVDWITPNQAELAALSGTAISRESDLEDALRTLGRRHPQLSIVATGGDNDTANTVDIMVTPGSALRRFTGGRVHTTSTHGTGCAFSSALLARLILGDDPGEAVAAAKSYVAEALRRAPGLGKGRGPMNLLWPLTRP